MRVNFKLWGKIELDEEEQGLINRYDFDKAVLIAAFQPGLLRRAVIIGAGAFLVGLLFFGAMAGPWLGFLLASAAGIGTGFWWFNEKRETVYVRDLLHGRHFSCDSVIELARKEAWLTTIVGFLRQVMESAKHWDGTESHKIVPLPKDEARQVILRGL
ncbi:MAG TPA: hypothetical protein VN240_04935 [Propylenella sp.]|nr:hypothetical protein [Propylenella sp.]